MAEYYLCHQKELVEHQPRGFNIELEQGDLNCFVLKQAGELRAYLNHCPHLGTPLNWQPDQFLSLTGSHIQCATHGALFNLEDGHCIVGPCAGRSLTALRIKTTADGKVFVVSAA